MSFLEKQIERYRNDIIKSVQEQIKIKSVKGESKPGMPFGEGPREALEHALKLSEELGFKTKNVDGYAGHAEYGEGDDIVGVLVHLDVVPEGTGWVHPPYGGEIHDGKIYGRGTIDNKGPAIAALYALKALKDSGVNMKRRVRIIFGTDEESGWEDMDYYMENEENPMCGFSPDALFPIINSEKGI
ncbi:MAG TPA: Sapep family Mn(2+)-dependent dipeptidase, partial [Thermoanaerobacterales bacterium]|nr:Sapep family Mn(2+)-dependent dipeptidase [Thermoanaerobacterales bacterium]